MFYDFQMENKKTFIEFVKAEASRLWHEMFRLRSYGGKRRAGDLRGGGCRQAGEAEARDSGVYLSQTQLRGNVYLSPCLWFLGERRCPRLLRGMKQKVCGCLCLLSLSESDSPGITTPQPGQQAAAAVMTMFPRKCFPFYVLTQSLYYTPRTGSSYLGLWRKLEILRRTCGW